MVSLVGTVLEDEQTLGLTTAQVGLLGSIYLAGEVVGALVMIAGGVIAWFFGVDAEPQSLESIAKPLSARETAGATRFQGPMPRLPSVDQRRRPPTNPGGDDPDSPPTT